MKREDLQSVFSFKIRGAYNLVKQLSREEKDRGVICVSAGNHGQGVAFSAARFGIKATVVMPVTTPIIKIKAVKRLGAKAVLFGDSYAEAEEHCLDLQKQFGQTFIHPFDHPLVIAGQGTIGKELLEDASEIDKVFVPVGGGGLISGIACYLKELKPSITIIGVEPEESDGMIRSIQADRRISLPRTGTFADGVAVKQVGQLTFELTRQLVDEFISVSNDEICSAIENIYDETRAILEPAGALAMAGLKKHLEQNPQIKNKHLVAISSGANMSFERLQFVSERAQIGEKRESLLAIKLPERAGALFELCKNVVSSQPITEFNYRYRSPEDAYIFVGIENAKLEDKEKFCQNLAEHSYEYIDLTENELAKDHIRHMVGGPRQKNIEHELLYRFRFPDRPKALLEFLVMLGNRWNISLFHHRSHGTDFNRVLVGLQVPPEDRCKLESVLDNMTYAYTDETDNSAYQIFL